MRVFELFEGDKYKCTCLPNDKDPDCPKHGLEPMDVGDALDEQGMAEGSGNFLDDDFYAYDPETKEIKDTWSHKSVGRRHSEYRAQQQGLKVVSGMRAKSLGLHYPTNNEAKQRLDPKCWTGYKKQGTKMKGGVRVNNCVPVEEGAMSDMDADKKDKQYKGTQAYHAKKKAEKEKTAKNEAVDFDRSKNPNYPNDAATQKHRLDTAKRLLSDPKTDDASRKEAAAIIARMEPKGKK